MNRTTTSATAALPLAAARTPGDARSARNAAAAPDPAQSLAAETLQSRFALRLAARLTEGSQTLGPDIDERLRFGREQALERARVRRRIEASTLTGVTAGGAAVLGLAGANRRGSRWWLKLASVLPVFALVAGLILIQRWQDNVQVSVAAEIDAALLSDDLPPTAYSDAGFAEYLKHPDQ